MATISAPDSPSGAGVNWNEELMVCLMKLYRTLFRMRGLEAFRKYTQMYSGSLESHTTSQACDLCITDRAGIPATLMAVKSTCRKTVPSDLLMKYTSPARATAQ